MRRLVQGVTHDAAGQLHGDLADLASQLLEDSVALCADLLLSAAHGRLSLLLGLGGHVLAQLLRRLPRLLDDAVRLVAGAG